MRHVLDTTGSREGLASALTECLDAYMPAGLLILAGGSNGFTPETIDPILREIPVPVVGGIFPAIIHGKELLQKGTLVIALPRRPRVQVLRSLSQRVKDVETVLDDMLLGEHGHTMFVLVDGLALEVGPLLSSLFSVFGLEVNYLGGGAGALRAESTPCLITNEGLIRDAAVLAVTDLHSGVGICHGMESVSGPHWVTEVHGTRIGSLDWQPARARFQELIHAVDPSLQANEGFPISDEFCLAVNRIGGEKVIRDPYKADPDGSLHVIVGLSEGGTVDLVRATPDSTIRAAAQALEFARSSYRGPNRYASVLCFDCFGRWQFLRERFIEELDALQDDHCELLGALTIGGEVANCGRDFLDYYNRTCVVGVLED